MPKQSKDTANDIKLLYIGSVLPDKPAFNSPAFSRAGAMFQENLLCGLSDAGITPSMVISYRHIPSFPNYPCLWVNREFTELRNGIKVLLLPFLNITPLKQIFIGLATFILILLWGWNHKQESRRVIYTFNLTVPPGIFVWMGALFIGAKTVVSLNDINIPGQTVTNSLLNRFDFFMHKHLIPRFNGYIAVADKIMSDFAPGRKYIRLEGGVTSEMLQKSCVLESTKPKTEKVFKIVSAGSLDEANGFRLLLEAFSLLKGNDFKLLIAGGGPLAGEIQEAAKKDPRIIFYGYISIPEVLTLYREADILINMRLTKLLATQYFFPSKLMEYLASGTPVISTCTGHVESEFGEVLYMLKDESPEGLANLIIQSKMLPSEVLAEKGAKASAFMALHKTWDVQGEKVADYINSLFSPKAER